MTLPASSRITTPTAFSAPFSSQPGSSDLNTIRGTPITISVTAWPTPHQAPSRAAARVSAWSEAISEVTATRWSGSEACRSPRANATSSATSSGAPSKNPVSHSSAWSTGPNSQSKFIAPAFLRAHAGHRPDDRVVGEVRLPAELPLQRAAQLVEFVRVDGA